MIQRRAARFVMGRYGQQDSVMEMLEELFWDTLEQRRLKARIIMGCWITHKLVMIPSEQLKPSKDTNRGHDMKYIQIGTNRNYYKHSFFPEMIPLWNCLPQTIVSATSIEDFRDNICCPHQTSLLTASYTDILTHFYLVYLCFSSSMLFSSSLLTF